MLNADFKCCAGNSPYCLGMTEFNCCGIGMEHEYRDKDVSEFNYCEKGIESEADPAGKGKDFEDDFVHSSPKINFLYANGKFYRLALILILLLAQKRLPRLL